MIQRLHACWAFLHGRAADIAILDMGMEALIAGDLPEYLGEAWLSVQT
ncbi:MAG: hypothetical protein R2778_18395 [Saprospiraceae bacterium]